MIPNSLRRWHVGTCRVLLVDPNGGVNLISRSAWPVSEISGRSVGFYHRNRLNLPTTNGSVPTNAVNSLCSQKWVGFPYVSLSFFIFPEKLNLPLSIMIQVYARQNDKSILMVNVNECESTSPNNNKPKRGGVNLI